MWLVYQDSFIAFLVLDPVGLRPYKQFFREQKGWIWFDLAGWAGAGWHNSGQTNPRPVRSHPREGAEKLYDPGKPNEALMNKNSRSFIKNPNFIEYTFPDHWYMVAICRWPCIQDLSSRHIVDLQRRKLWICVWPDVGYWHWAGVRWREAMVWKILEINSLCGNQRRFLPFGKSGSWTINRGLLPANEAAASASWQNSKYFHPFPSTINVTSNHSFTLIIQSMRN